MSKFYTWWYNQKQSFRAYPTYRVIAERAYVAGVKAGREACADLLDACETLVEANSLDYQYIDEDMLLVALDKAQAAIAKATGEDT